MTTETSADPRYLLLPGWLDSDAPHWQSRWEALHGCRRVEQNDWLWPKRGDWMARLDEVLLESDRAAVLIAHSLGCQLVAAWAAHSRHTACITGALLVAATDTARDDTPPQLASWRHIVRNRLPFAATLLYSEDEPFCRANRAQTMAADWGANAVSLGVAGHINAQTGLGDWDAGLAWLRRATGAPP